MFRLVLQPALMFTLLVPLLSVPASAHSLKGLEDQLLGAEKFFQPVDRPAPDFELADAQGRNVQMTDFRGKVVILNFIYASCGDVCPLHSVVIAELQRLINPTPMQDQVAFISITTDPEHDRGAVLSDYGDAQGLDPANWMFLTSAAGQPEDATRQLARQYGLEFTQTEDGEQMHGLVTHVIDREGRLRGRFHGLRFKPVNLVVFVNGLINDVHRPGEEPTAPTDLWSWIGSFFAPANEARP